VSGDSPQFKFKENGWNHTVIRLALDDNFDYLYVQRHYKAETLQRDSKFEYGGIYFKKEKTLYDLQYDLRIFDGDYEKSRADKLKEQMQELVRQLVEATIKNDRKNLSVTKLTDRDKENYEYYIKYQARKDARELYLQLNGEAADEYEYKSDYHAQPWKEETLLEYILDPAKYISTQAAEFIQTQQGGILLDFLRGDALAKAYAELTANPQSNIHTINKICKALATADAKMVTVTIRRGETELTFKYEVYRLKQDPENKYCKYGADAQGRRELENAFEQGDTDFTPQEIIRITYGRNTLYEAEAKA